VRKLIGAALLAVGVLMLVFRGFSCTREKHEARVAGFGLELKRKERVEIPPWVGAVVALAGGALIASAARGARRRD
jgi:drug/metabolite transporter (DMT)-like permease